MAQVIIVSNRLPVSVKKDNGELVFTQGLGGIATGLASYADDPRNHWIGWPGIASDELTSEDKKVIVTKLEALNCTPIFLTQKQIDEFYNGYSNSVLWPLFHGLPVNQKDPARLKRWWQAYRRVNRQYAEVVSSQAESDNQIWVHDYHLLLLPEMLRVSQVGQNIGLFLHIPFPAVKAFSRLPEHKKLLSGMLGADLVGFHITGYVQAFMDNCRAAGLGDVGETQITLPDDRVVRAAEFPMGIDYEKFAAANKLKPVRAAVKQYRRRYRRRKLIVSVDRLDPSKGLVERLEAYRQFLEFFPRRRGKVVFAMVAAPSRTDITAYQRLSKKLQALADDINATYGSPSWQPVDYINVAQPFESVAALFQIADVAFITPLKDGMNLTAKEFVASNRQRGVLILSQTAGAAEELSDALIVNPEQPETVIDALQQALTMRRSELKWRLKRMRVNLSSNTVHDWAKSFVETLKQPVPGTPRLTRTLNRRLQKLLQADYQQAKRRLLLLDYDGTLVPFTENYESAAPPKALLELLGELSADKRNDLVLVSGRSAKDLSQWFSKLPVALVAEHGAAIKQVGRKNWRTIEKSDTAWKPLLLLALDKYASLTPGALVEIKPHSIVWHYRAATPYYAQKYAVIIKRALKPILKTYALEIVQGNKILEIKNPRVSKGAAVQRWLKNNYDFVLSIGDDATDEEMFAVLPVAAYSLKVGRGLTAARLRLPTYKNALALLKQLAKTA
jgi:trehalose 6-phosphate synthase/phosphatase